LSAIRLGDVSFYWKRWWTILGACARVCMDFLLVDFDTLLVGDGELIPDFAKERLRELVDTFLKQRQSSAGQLFSR
jgi:hypothetical protein